MINPLEGFSGINLEGTGGVQPPIPAQQPKPKQKLVVKKAPTERWDSTPNTYKAGDVIMPFDKRPVKVLVKEAAVQAGISPEFLHKSAYQEGMNKMLVDPSGASQAWENAYKKDISLGNYRVDGFYNYGLDTFGNPGYAESLQAKGYLPKGFEKKYKVYQAMNDSKKNPQIVNTAAFVDNKSALMAKAAMLRDGQDHVDQFAASHKLKLTPKERAYFTGAYYNGGPGGMRQVMNQYMLSKDKAGFIDKGLTTRKDIHSHVYPRVTELEAFTPLFK